MKRKFKKDDKVRCILPNGSIIEGEIYTVEKQYFGIDSKEYVKLVERPHLAFYSHRFELVEKEQQKTEKEMKTPYQEAQEAWIKMVDLKVGDTVKVLTTAKRYQYGWLNSWERSMNLSVGKEFVVWKIYSDAGIGLSDNLSYPFFVLEKVAEALPKPIKISDAYQAEFRPDGSIKVGCQEIPFSLLKQIYETAAQIQNKE